MTVYCLGTLCFQEHKSDIIVSESGTQYNNKLKYYFDSGFLGKLSPSVGEELTYEQ